MEPALTQQLLGAEKERSMLGTRTSQQGLTLIEIMIGLVLLAILGTLAVPAYQSYVQNAQIRNGTEGILNGMQLARAEALSRNTIIELALNTDSSWVISNPLTGEEFQRRDRSDGSRNVNATIFPVGADRITFNGMGWIAGNNDASPSITRIDVTSATSVDPELRPLRIVVGTGGAMKMCDPAVAAGDPRACP